jgi:hypothetical protein
MSNPKRSTAAIATVAMPRNPTVRPKLPATKPESVVLSEAPTPEIVPTNPCARLNLPVPAVRSATITPPVAGFVSRTARHRFQFGTKAPCQSSYKPRLRPLCDRRSAGRRFSWCTAKPDERGRVRRLGAPAAQRHPFRRACGGKTLVGWIRQTAAGRF